MERIGGEREGQTSSIGQVALASFIGTAIEWYDFFLYRSRRISPRRIRRSAGLSPRDRSPGRSRSAGAARSCALH